MEGQVKHQVEDQVEGQVENQVKGQVKGPGERPGDGDFNLPDCLQFVSMWSFTHLIIRVTSATMNYDGVGW